MVNKTTRNLFLALVGVHTVLWIALELARPASGGIDESPAFLLLLLLYYLDTPARWFVQGQNGPENFGALFLVATLQWAVIAAIFSGMAMYWKRRKSRAVSRGEVPAP